MSLCCLGGVLRARRKASSRRCATSSFEYSLSDLVRPMLNPRYLDYIDQLHAFHIPSLPPEEQDFGGIIWMQFNNVLKLLDQFMAAVALFDQFEESMYLHPLQIEGQFPMIAARDGSVTLWNYYDALTSMKQCLERELSTVLRTRISLSKIESARALFRQYFGADTIKGVRDSVGHVADLMANPKDFNKNATRVGDLENIASPGNFLIGQMNVRVYETTTFKGIVVRYEISQTSLLRLIEITDCAFSAIVQTSTDA